MKESLLLQTMRRLSSADTRTLAQLVRCEAFNRKPEVVRLFDQLVADLSSPTATPMTAERLHAATFPDKKMDGSALRRAMSDLLEVVRTSLRMAEMAHEKPLADQLLRGALRRRGIENLLKTEEKQAIYAAETSPHRDARWHYRQYQLNMERLETVSMRERSGRVDLRPLHEHLTAFYLAEILRFACGALTHQAISAQAYDADWLRRAFEMAENGAWLTDFPAIAIYYHACRALENLDESAHFEQFLVILREKYDQFHPSEMRTIYLAGINACIRRMNRGQKPFIREAFDLYKIALERGFLYENGWISGFSYKNIIRIGTALGEHDWTTHFFETEKSHLPPKERDALYRYNLAWLFIQKQDYARAMPMLRSLELDDRLNRLEANRMLLKSYYELGEWAALSAFLETFSAFLKRQKDLGYHLDLNLNLVKCTQQLLEKRHLFPKSKEKLRVLFEKTEPLADKEWLLGKL
jgi:hypothetical protein